MSFDIRQDFSGDDYDEEAAKEYAEALFGRFITSPEARALDEQEDDFDGFYWSNALIDYGISYCSVTPATMTRADFEEVLFSIFPRKVSVEASKAGEIVAELRAFWRFLQREFGLKNAADCLAVLDDNAVDELRHRLSDPRHFGMAKSFFMAGKNAGFDVETEGGLQKWVKEHNANPNRYDIPVPGLPLGVAGSVGSSTTDDGAEQRRKLRNERKRKRQQAKASRRRNR